MDIDKQTHHKSQKPGPWQKNAMLLLVGQCVTLLGSSIVQMALIWHVATETSSGARVTLLTLSAFIPQMLISPLAGVWADQHSRKRLIVLSDGAIAAATLCLSILMTTSQPDESHLPFIILVSTVRSVGAGIQTPSVSAIIPQLVPKRYLIQINGINGSAQGVIQFVSPLVAGAILATGPIQGILLIDVATALIGIGFLLLIKVDAPLASPRGKERGVLLEMRAGLQNTFTSSFLTTLLLAYGAFIFLSVPSGFLTTLMIQRTFGSNYLYLTISEMAGFLGMVLGGVLLGTWGGFKNRNATLVAGMLCYALFSIALGLARACLKNNRVHKAVGYSKLQS